MGSKKNKRKRKPEQENAADNQIPNTPASPKQSRPKRLRQQNPFFGTPKTIAQSTPKAAKVLSKYAFMQKSM
jgi:hypothetical protein